MSKPLILISNDDGITSRGIRKLISLASEFGEVVVVAPDSPQSGMGHAITVGDTLRLQSSDLFEGVEAYECTGTPADCVKLAKHQVLRERKIDLVLSGINHGSNSSISVLYSGTMSAAIEGAIEGLPSMGFSLCDYDHNAPLDHVDSHLKKIIQQALEHGIPPYTALNINFPAMQNQPIKGIKFCRQAKARWEENFDVRKDPYGQTYFWMVGNFVNYDDQSDNDEFALSENYISIVPCQFDMTAHHAISKLAGGWEL